MVFGDVRKTGINEKEEIERRIVGILPNLIFKWIKYEDDRICDGMMIEMEGNTLTMKKRKGEKRKKEKKNNAVAQTIT